MTKKAGGFAGIAVDAALFPLDTIKTRLQSPLGFVGSGGFRGVYSGLGAAVLGSVPTGCTFRKILLCSIHFHFDYLFSCSVFLHI